MKRFAKVLAILVATINLAACGNSKKESQEYKHLTDLSTELEQYWYKEASHQGKESTKLDNLSWKKADKTECFTMLSKKEALFGTMEDGKIVYARIYSVGAKDDAGFYPLKQTKSIVSESYLRDKVKNKKSFEKIDQAGFTHIVQNETYYSSTANISHKIQKIRFYKDKDSNRLYREQSTGNDNVTYYRYSK